MAEEVKWTTGAMKAAKSIFPDLMCNGPTLVDPQTAKMQHSLAETQKWVAELVSRETRDREMAELLRRSYTDMQVEHGMTDRPGCLCPLCMSVNELLAEIEADKAGRVK